MKMISLVLQCSILVIGMNNVLAANYYVAQNGNDANTGAISSPFKSFKKAESMLLPGDTLNIRGGTYYERLVATRSGKPGNYITYQAYPGETATIDGSNVNINWHGLVEVSNASYIKVNRLRTINSKWFGVWGNTSTNIIVSNNYTVTVQTPTGRPLESPAGRVMRSPCVRRG